ncbi:hypothetical protein GGD63_007221 [Bradyrhizobium sp. cir1]|nr:hypothetical protein [Bradyrhizobium sp. cir1]
MKRRKFRRELKIEAIKLVRERRMSVAQAGRDLDVHENVLRKWVKEDLRWQDTVFAHATIVQSSSGTAAACSHDGWAERYGAWCILSTALRAGNAKAVTATARKIAVLFYNTLRHGMT